MHKSHLLSSVLSIALCSVVAVSAAQAQSRQQASDSSFLGGSIGRTDYSLDNGSGIFDSQKGRTAYNIHAGKFFNPNFGVELGYTDFGRIDRGGGSTKANGANLSVLAKFPVSDVVNILGKMGATYSHTDVSSAPSSGVISGTDHGFGLSYGVAAEFVINAAWSALLQYDSHKLHFAGDRDDRVGVTSLGIRVNF